MMKNILFICTLTALLSACSESRLFKKEEQYTRMMAKAVTTARDLVNEPANVMTPAALAAKAKEICEKNNIKCTILEKQDCEALGMNS